MWLCCLRMRLLIQIFDFVPARICSASDSAHHLDRWTTIKHQHAPASPIHSSSPPHRTRNLLHPRDSVICVRTSICICTHTDLHGLLLLQIVLSFFFFEFAYWFVAQRRLPEEGKGKRGKKRKKGKEQDKKKRFGFLRPHGKEKKLVSVLRFWVWKPVTQMQDHSVFGFVTTQEHSSNVVNVINWIFCLFVQNFVLTLEVCTSTCTDIRILHLHCWIHWAFALDVSIKKLESTSLCWQTHVM